MPSHLLNLLLLCITLTGLHANTDTRTWTLQSKESLRAELVSYDLEQDRVELLIDDTKTKHIPFSEFSEIDKAWIIEWNEIDQEIRALNDSLGGSLEHFVVVDNYETDLYAYFPSNYQGPQKSAFPLMILFNAGAKAQRFLLRHMEAAEEAGFVVISCGQFRNTKNNPEKEAAFFQRFQEVFPAIQDHFTYAPEQVYLGGNSGGAWRAYHYSAWIDYPWAGIYANGGWLGGKQYANENYADNMRVAIVNGNNDKAANNWIDYDTRYLNIHNAEIAIIAFEGGHQIPPTRTQTKAFKWLLSSEGFDEK